MNRPESSFIIWFSPRTGSSLLCKALEQTEICGKAGEYLNDQREASLQHFYKVSSFDQLCAKMWNMGTSANGIFGLKYSMFQTHHERLMKELCELQGRDYAFADWQIMAQLFPNCKHLFLTRRNKIRLAASWWKAIKDEQWHKIHGESFSRDAEFYTDKYDADALKHLLIESCLREAQTEEFFRQNNISPMTIVYEDFVDNYKDTLKSILDFLNIDAEGASFKSPYYQKTADANSEAWITRFREELQEGWDNVAW